MFLFSQPEVVVCQTFHLFEGGRAQSGLTALLLLVQHGQDHLAKPAATHGLGDPEAINHRVGTGPGSADAQSRHELDLGRDVQPFVRAGS